MAAPTIRHRINRAVFEGFYVEDDETLVSKLKVPIAQLVTTSWTVWSAKRTTTTGSPQVVGHDSKP